MPYGDGGYGNTAYGDGGTDPTEDPEGDDPVEPAVPDEPTPMQRFVAWLRGLF